MPTNGKRREDVQKIILALLLSRKGACPMPRLDEDYHDQEGEYIPWKELGHISLLSFLQSIPRSIQIEKRDGTYYVRGVASDKSKHVSSLVARQKSTFSKRPTSYRRSFRPSHYFPNTASLKVNISAELLGQIIQIVKSSPQGVTKDYILKVANDELPYSNITIADLERQLINLSHEVYMSNNRVYPKQQRAKPFVSDDKNLNKSTERNTSDTSPIYTISGLSSDENEDDPFSFLPAKDAKERPKNVNSMSTVKKSTCKFLQETVSKCHVEHKESIENPNIQYETSPHSERNSCSHYEIKDKLDVNHLDTESADMIISDRIKFRLEKLIATYPNGIWCADLPEIYLKTYKHPLNYSELGFNSVREFASYLPSIFHCKQPYDGSDHLLYNAKNQVPQNNEVQRQSGETVAAFYNIHFLHDEPEAMPAIVSLETSRKLIPEGVMTIGESVGQISVSLLKDGTKPYIEVYVVEVFTPTFFWIQLRKAKKIFDKFTEHMHNFYVEQLEKYKIPNVVLEKGLNCACVYNGVWHRGIIKTVKPDLQVVVLFYDYGTLKTYPSTEIYYLHRSFSTIPAQAIPCGLYNVKPYASEKWSVAVTHQFAVRTSEKPLIAVVSKIDEENNSMMITLTDTLEDEDVHINDWLVEQDLAAHGEMVRMWPRNFAFSYYLECRNHVALNSVSHNKSQVIHSNVSVETKIAASASRPDSITNELCQKLNCRLQNNQNSSRTNVCPETESTFRKDYFYDTKVDFSQRKNNCMTSESSINSIKGKISSRAPIELVTLYKRLKYFITLEDKNSLTAENMPHIANLSPANICLQYQHVGARGLKSNEPHVESCDASNSVNTINNKELPHTAVCENDCRNGIQIKKMKQKKLRKKRDILASENRKMQQALDYPSAESREDKGAKDTQYFNACHKQDELYIPSVLQREKEMGRGNLISSINLQSDKETHNIIGKTNGDISTAKTPFFNAVYNSIYFYPLNEDVCWSSDGHINYKKNTFGPGTSFFKERIPQGETVKNIAITNKLLSILRGKQITTNSIDVPVVHKDHNFSLKRATVQHTFQVNSSSNKLSGDAITAVKSKQVTEIIDNNANKNTNVSDKKMKMIRSPLITLDNSFKENTTKGQNSIACKSDANDVALISEKLPTTCTPTTNPHYINLDICNVDDAQYCTSICESFYKDLNGQTFTHNGVTSRLKNVPLTSKLLNSIMMKVQNTPSKQNELDSDDLTSSDEDNKFYHINASDSVENDKTIRDVEKEMAVKNVVEKVETFMQQNGGTGYSRDINFNVATDNIATPLQIDHEKLSVVTENTQCKICTDVLCKDLDHILHTALNNTSKVDVPVFNDCDVETDSDEWDACIDRLPFFKSIPQGINDSNRTFEKQISY